MSLQFILGNSGSGKTAYMYQQLADEAAQNPKKDYLVVVPEQFTMQTQRDLVDRAKHKAIMNIDVVSFQRLAYRIFDELGKKNLVVLEETGKNLVLRKVAQSKEQELTVLRPNLNRMGYISEVKSLLSEFTQYNITPELLQEFVDSGKATAVLAAKLRDVNTIYRGFQEFMEGKYITAEEILTVLCQVVDESEILKDSVIVFDEFTGFTPIQMQLMRKLLPIADRILVSLTIDSKSDIFHSRGVQELFDMPKKTIASLMQMCDLLHVEVLDPVILSDGDQKRFVKAPSLYFMEQNLFRPTYQRAHGKVDEIQMAAVKNPREELLLTAREIARLVREQGYRYKDIAVVTGATEIYSNYVDTIFGKYKIPYFMDMTREILFHPFIEFIRATLEVIQNNYSYEAMFRFLRCGYCDMEEEDIDLLENYILATGIKGKKAWSKRFLRMPRRKGQIDLEKMEQLRAYINSLLLPVSDAFSGEGATVGSEIMALYQLMTVLEIEKKLAKKEQEYLEAGNQAKSKEYGQIYRIVMELFDKLYLLLGEEQMEIREFTEILDAGLDAAKVAVIPPGYDTVTIGDIERTRLNHVKILFFVGVNDGIIPKAGTQGGIISQYERELLAESEVELAPSTREQVFIQKYYLYLNLTKPSERLYLSYSNVDSEGKSIRPSYLIGTIRKIFPDMELHVMEDMEKIPNFSTVEAAKDYLIHGRKDENWYALAKCFLQDKYPKEQQEFMQILRAEYLYYEDEPISKAVAQAVYGKTIEGSVTRLEKFAACAYAHFLQYGLHIEEREESSFASMDIGNIYHEALQSYSEALQESSYDWFTVPEEVQNQMAEDALRQAVEKYPSLSMYATAENMHQIDRMSHILQQTVWALTKQVRKGRFTPSEFEISFSQEENLEAIHFRLSEEERMKLAGRIDRLDTCEEEGRVYVKVVDYKSGSTKFDMVKIYQGMQLQLVVYMNAAMEIEQKLHPKAEVIPGGILYYHIDDPVIEVEGELSEEEYKDQILMALRPDGLVNREESIYRAMDDEFEEKSDAIPVQLTKKGALAAASKVAWTEEFELVQEYVRAKMEESGRAIYAGKVSVNPYESGLDGSCRYCPYHAVCGLDLKIPGYQIRSLEAVKKEEVFDRMRTDLALQERGEQ